MTERRPTLDRVYQRWLSTRQDEPDFFNAVPVGYRRCTSHGCITLIEEGQERAFCYWHGGKPNKPKPPFVGAAIEEYLDELRSHGRLLGVHGHPYRA